MSRSVTRVDPHVKILDDRVVRRAKRFGLDVLVYAPHFTRLPEIQKRAAAYSDDDLLVVPARELFTGSWRERRHVLALGLDSPIPDFTTLDGAMAELREQDAIVLAPHPEFLTVSLDEATIRRYRDLVAAVEVYNPKHWARDNRRAREIARDLDLPTFGSSYAHRHATVGEVWTEFERTIETEADLLAAFREATPRWVRHRKGLIHETHRRAEFADLGHENTVKKFDRVVLSGTEATHPRQPAYEGQFDDVAVD